MKKIKKRIGSVLIYTLFLINIALVFSLVVFNIAGVVIDDNEYQNIIRKLSNNILYKGNLALKYLDKLNSNGGGFIDNLSCPTAVTMDGTTSSGVISTSLYADTFTKYCTGSYLSYPVNILFNSTYTDFTGALYRGTQVTVVAGSATSNFSDADATHLSFSPAGLAGIDNMDDNFNSDDYKISSTGAVYYPSDFEDDDGLPRKIIYFYIPPDTGYNSIFFNNDETNQLVENNTNNDDALNLKIGDVSAGYLYLDVDKAFGIKLVRFNKSRFNQFNELVPLETFESESMSGAIGYIQDDGSVSNLGTLATGDEYVFDFSNQIYGVFLSNYSTGTLLFQMRGYTPTGTGVYINPIDDTNSVISTYLGNDIIIDNEGRYIYNQFEIVGLK